jgi:DNA-directed RNA polymerase specialized sigma24 family protein
MDLEATFFAAHKYDARAMVTLLEAYDPRVNRLALGLIGQHRLGRKVARIVMRQALDAIPKLRDLDAAERWFNHRTVLESRQHAISSKEETLIDGSVRTDLPYVSFVRAFRTLPIQQREALLLTHGEKLNIRYVGIAMDCSADAANNHLAAGTGSLKTIAGSEFTPLLEALVAAYRALTPPPDVSRREIRKRVSRHLFPRRVKRAILLLILAAIVLAVWHWRQALRSLIP